MEVGKFGAFGYSKHSNVQVCASLLALTLLEIAPEERHFGSKVIQSF